MTTRLCLLALLGAMVLSAQAVDDGDKPVTVPKRYLSQDALAHQVPSQAAAWIGIGKEIGEAVNAGLGAVVDQASRFGTTKVGTFVMVMIAWKVIGKDLLGIVLGVPFLIGGVFLWVWSMRRFFFGRRVLVKHEGVLKEWGTATPYKFSSDEARLLCGIAHCVLIVAWVGLMVFVAIL